MVPEGLLSLGLVSAIFKDGTGLPTSFSSVT